jgi:hypothetical protein
MGLAETAWDAMPRDPVTTTVNATVGVFKMAAAQGEKWGDVAYAAIAEKDYKKAALIATADNPLVKVMDPKTSDEEMGKTIGKATGTALLIIATSKAGGGGGGKGPPPPPTPPPPVKPPTVPSVTVPMKTLPKVSGPPTVPRPAAPAAPAAGGAKPPGPALQRHLDNLKKAAHNQRWNEHFDKRVNETRPARDLILKEQGWDAARKAFHDIFVETDKVIGPKQ